MGTIQKISYVLQFAEILFLCRHSKPTVTGVIITSYVMSIIIMAIDRMLITPRFIGYLVSFLIAAHYIFIVTVSAYISVWFIMHRFIGTTIDRAQAFVLVFSLAIVIYGFINSIIVRTSSYVLPTDKVERDIRIVQISDLHICNMYGPKELSRLVDRVNSLDPDIICITGDMFTTSLSINSDMDSLYSEFRKLNAKYGTYVIQGNHDVTLMGQLEELCNKSGFQLLTDEKVSVSGIDIIGRLCSPNGKSLESIVVDKDDFTVVLDHIPDRIDESVANNVDLELCGHTHGGQMFPIDIMSRLSYGINAGAEYFNNTLVVVNQGAYLIYPYCRIVGKSEIVCIDLKSNN